MTFQHDSESSSQQYPLITAQIVTLQDVITATSLSRSTIYRMIKSQTFPQPLALTSKRCGFYAHEVNEWLMNRPRTL
ncbi:AlpA family phage regulatory protein [uncultured Neptuniibacter sp.]|uniref:helix-turn-helix transcriptional regulator n=1 Tax=uncultured Neptuniibacter sp. TaxID=502143 RepID=UPI0034552AD4